MKLDPAPKGAGGLLSKVFGKSEKPTPLFEPDPGSASTGHGPKLRSTSDPEPFYGTDEYLPKPEDEVDDSELVLSSPAAEEMVQALEFESADPDDHELIEVPGIGAEMPNLITGSFDAQERSGGVPERVVRCVECETELHVSLHASSTLCKRCGCYVNLEDFAIRNHRRENIKTRGDITIHRKASLNAGNIACDNLKVFGKISGQVDCSGDAMFRSSGKVVGSVRCKHLYVHKLSTLRFIPGIRAQTAEVHGHVEGDIICEGTIKISKTGAVIGNCIAPAVSLEDGGELSGQMMIMKPDDEMDDDYIRRAQEAQDDYFENDLEEDLEAFKVQVENEPDVDDDEVMMDEEEEDDSSSAPKDGEKNPSEDLSGDDVSAA